MVLLDNGERLQEWEPPTRSYDTASLPYRIERMTKEKKSFATERPFSWPWDTILLIKEAGGPMFVRGTDIEVEWCPVTQMFWEV